MATARQIRIVKRSEREEQKTAPAQATEGGVRNSERDAVTVIAGWVQELRRKKVAEATRGFQSLFGQPAAGTTQG